MKKETLPPPAGQDVHSAWRSVVKRRSFLSGLGAAGAAALLETTAQAAPPLLPGDEAVLQFLLAAEILESDLWSQYAELGGVNGGNPAYKAALQNLDNDMPQYVTDNTDDEISHMNFLTAYLTSRHATPISLEGFRTLLPTPAFGANQTTKHLTNLQNLTVDTSYYTRYRSSENPDLGAPASDFTGPVTLANLPAIPVDETKTPHGTNMTIQNMGPLFADPKAFAMQAIANTAAFHFAFIEQGGSSLYTTLAQKVTDLEVLRIVISIGGVEIDHFSLWHDKVGNAVSQPIGGNVSGFPDLNASANLELTQTNKILPEPCDFLNKGLPECSVIRPTSTENSGAAAAVNGLTNDGLFMGQPPAFFKMLMDLASAADAAKREF